MDSQTHHRRSLRLPGYDYAQLGAYFLTICTVGRELFFDHAVIRRIAEECWEAIPAHFPFVAIDEWVLMPNHLHAVLFIGREARRGVQLNAPTPRDPEDAFSSMSPVPASLGLVVRTYKAAVTTRCRSTGHGFFGWQRNYYEHVVRDEDDLARIRRYIIDNPQKWELDDDHPNRWHGTGMASRGVHL